MKAVFLIINLLGISFTFTIKKNEEHVSRELEESITDDYPLSSAKGIPDINTESNNGHNKRNRESRKDYKKGEESDIFHARPVHMDSVVINITNTKGENLTNANIQITQDAINHEQNENTIKTKMQKSRVQKNIIKEHGHKAKQNKKHESRYHNTNDTQMTVVVNQKGLPDDKSAYYPLQAKSYHTVSSEQTIRDGFRDGEIPENRLNIININHIHPTPTFDQITKVQTRNDATGHPLVMENKNHNMSEQSHFDYLEERGNEYGSTGVFTKKETATSDTKAFKDTIEYNPININNVYEGHVNFDSFYFNDENIQGDDPNTAGDNSDSSNSKSSSKLKDSSESNSSSDSKDSSDSNSSSDSKDSSDSSSSRESKDSSDSNSSSDSKDSSDSSSSSESKDSSDSTSSSDSKDSSESNSSSDSKDSSDSNSSSQSKDSSDSNSSNDSNDSSESNSSSDSSDSSCSASSSSSDSSQSSEACNVHSVSDPSKDDNSNSNESNDDSSENSEVNSSQLTGSVSCTSDSDDEDGGCNR